MKVLLAALNAKYIHYNLDVYSLRSYAKEYKNDIVIGEYTINNRTDDILEKIYRQQPDVLCFSCYIWNIEKVVALIQEYHKISPKTPIWLGGPEVSYEVQTFLEQHPQVTGIIIGEGERTFAQLCAFYHERKDEALLDEMRGIAYRKPDGSIQIQPPAEPMDMSQIPFCYEDIDHFKNRIIYYESSRGCPFNCSYCLSSIDKKLRFRDIELVKKELAFFMEKEVPQVKFVDRTFNCQHEHAMEIWRFIKEHDNGITNFHFEISADLLNEEELELLHDMRPGLVQLEIGVQSTNEETITEIHRTMKLDRLKETVKYIQSGGNIHEHLDLIAGLPYEDYETFKKSFDEVYALKPNQLQLGFLKVLKGSYMYEHASEYGMLYHDSAPYEVLSTKWLSYADTCRIKQVEEMLEVYYNSGQFEVTMKLMEHFFESPFSMYQELGQFYQEKGYFEISHTRMQRCAILLAFVKEKVPSAEKMLPMLQESLTFDLYYRENCKSRPAWAPLPSEFKRETRYYCKNGSKSHVEPFHYRFPEKMQKTLEHLPVYSEEPIYIHFDYEHRDPLDHQAGIKEVAKITNETEAGNE